MTDYSNQTDIFDPAAWTLPVHVIGLGGIGSALLFPLVKLGVPEIHLWDSDHVEPHNIPAQLIYRPSDIGKSKVESVCDFARRQEVECTLIPHAEQVTSTTPLQGIVISGVDSMTSRQAIWDALKFNTFVSLYMDGRMGGEETRVLSLNPCDIDQITRYEDWLFPDGDAAQLPCAARTVIHPPTVLAGVMVSNLTLFARGERPKESISMHLRTMQFVVSDR